MRVASKTVGRLSDAGTARLLPARHIFIFFADSRLATDAFGGQTQFFYILACPLRATSELTRSLGGSTPENPRWLSADLRERWVRISSNLVCLLRATS